MRPRDVPEERRAGSRAARAQGGRHQCEVVVLNEDRRGLVGQLLLDDGGELLVDALVGGPVGGAKNGPDMRFVAQRPEPLVGKSLVVAARLVRAEPEPPQPIRRAVGRNHDPVAVVHHIPVGTAGSMRDPDAAALAHQGVEGDRYAAGGGRPADGAVFVPEMLIRLPVGNDDQRPALGGCGA